MINQSLIEVQRREFHASLMGRILTVDTAGVASNADSRNRASVDIAGSIASQLSSSIVGNRLPGQTMGNFFETHCADYLRNTFSKLSHLRPGKWNISQVKSRSRLEIANYAQYRHLLALDRATSIDPELAAALGNDYTITPDVVISREPEADQVININEIIVDRSIAKSSSLREVNNKHPILHASVSCKWTIRSDRSQNSRSEALNLIRNRKGHLPHIAVVTAEPLPSRLASIALGTGDIDCVYHFALYELQSALKQFNYPDAQDMLDVMIHGNRLKDISDLPLDLAI